jgi:hypothetical protein
MAYPFVSAAEAAAAVAAGFGGSMGLGECENCV